MTRLVLQRLLWSIPTLIIVSALTFVLAWLTPGDAARVVLGTNTDPAAYEQLRLELGLDRPLLEQYTSWLAGAVRGDLGNSLLTHEPVASVLASRIGVTLSLVVLATIAAGLVGLVLGVTAAVRGGAVARIIDIVALVGMSIPVFWLALMLILLFAVQFTWFPATGYVPFAFDPGSWANALVLPVTAAACGGVATIAKQARGALVDAMGSEYVRALRANGLPAHRIILSHALRNAAVPVVTVTSLVMIGLLGGTILVEQVFALPGLGQLAVTSTGQHDLPVLIGVVVVYTLIVVVVNLLADIANGWLSPKMRRASA